MTNEEADDEIAIEFELAEDAELNASADACGGRSVIPVVFIGL